MSKKLSGQRYIVYLTAPAGSQPAGTVVDAVLWDGVAALTLPTGCALHLDAACQYPIGGEFAP